MNNGIYGSSFRRRLSSDVAILIYIAAVDFAFHMAFAGSYGYFRDELYYIVSGQHLSFGYVDFPPMIAVLAAVMYAIAGDSLVSIHVIPALVGGSLVFTSGMIARELGGKRKSQVMTAVATLFTLVFIATTSQFTMDIIDALWWSLAAYILVRLIRQNNPKLWIPFGLVAGLGVFTKLTMLFFLFAIMIGLLFTPARSHFRTKYFWLGSLITLAFLLPFISWNALNDWATVQFYLNYGGLTGGGPVGFFAFQLIGINPLNIPLFVGGLIFYLWKPQGRPFRALGFAYIVLYILFTIINAKSYFLTPVYPMLFAGGAVLFERSVMQNRRWRSPVYMGGIIITGLLFAPLLMPILPAPTYVSTYEFLTPLGNGGAGQANAGLLPQYLGDRLGWDTMTTSVAHVYNGLPPQQKAQACIFTNNYGEASALTFLGKEYGLPDVISGHNNFYLWGPGSCSGQVIITVGLTLSDDLQSFSNVTQAGLITCTYCMNSENNLPVYVCTGPKAPPEDTWATVKHFN
ncbi:MAG: glycosyltransferase family 39 protein [Nitrososphaerales archaeon]